MSNNPPNMPVKFLYHLVDENLEELSENEFNNFLEDKFPVCSKHYDTLRSIPPRATWQFERTARFMLFSAAQGNRVLHDYVLLKINPHPRQVIGYDLVVNALKEVEGTSLEKIANYLVPNGDGFEKILEIYDR